MDRGSWVISGFGRQLGLRGTLSLDLKLVSIRFKLLYGEFGKNKAMTMSAVSGRPKETRKCQL